MKRMCKIKHPSKTDKTCGVVDFIGEVSETGVMTLRAGNDESWKDCTRWDVKLGDVWVEGRFYTAADPSTPVEYIPTTEEKLVQTNTNVTSLEDAVTGLMDMMVLANGGM